MGTRRGALLRRRFRAGCLRACQVLCLILIPWGCGAEDSGLHHSGAAGTSSGAAGGTGGVGGGEHSWTLSLEAEVAAGVEETLCRYFVVPEPGLRVQRFEHSLSDRSHHLLLFPTWLKPSEIPNTGVVRNCDDGSPEKLVAPGMLFGGQPGGASVSYPEDAALLLPPGGVVLLEQHVVNTGTDSVAARASLRLVAAPEAARRQAGVLHFYNWAIFVPPLSGSRAEMNCEIPMDTRLSFGHGHMHERGTRFTAWVSTGGVQRELFTTQEWDAETQSFDQIGLVPGGSHIRFACDYENASERPFYQGLSALDDEMCSLTLGYVTESGERLPAAYEACASAGSGVVGTGGLGCNAVEQCAQAAWEAGPLEFALELQACFTSGCSAAPAAFRDLALCRATECSMPCHVLPGSAGVAAMALAAPACVGCMAANCASAEQACSVLTDGC